MHGDDQVDVWLQLHGCTVVHNRNNHTFVNSCCFLNHLQINLAKASTSRQPGDRNQAYDNRSQQFGERRTSAGGRDVGRAPAADAAGGAYGVYGGAVAAGGAVGIGAVGAGSILVPTMLPNGQMAYVLTATAAPGAVYDQGGRGGPVRRGDDRQGRGRGGVGRGDRYRPY